MYWFYYDVDISYYKNISGNKFSSRIAGTIFKSSLLKGISDKVGATKSV